MSDRYRTGDQWCSACGRLSHFGSCELIESLHAAAPSVETPSVHFVGKQPIAPELASALLEAQSALLASETRCSSEYRGQLQCELRRGHDGGHQYQGIGWLDAAETPSEPQENVLGDADEQGEAISVTSFKPTPREPVPTVEEILEVVDEFANATAEYREAYRPDAEKECREEMQTTRATIASAIVTLHAAATRSASAEGPRDALDIDVLRALCGEALVCFEDIEPRPGPATTELMLRLAQAWKGQDPSAAAPPSVGDTFPESMVQKVIRKAPSMTEAKRIAIQAGLTIDDVYKLRAPTGTLRAMTDESLEIVQRHLGIVKNWPDDFKERQSVVNILTNVESELLLLASRSVEAAGGDK